MTARFAGLCTRRRSFFHAARRPRTAPALRYTRAAVGPEILIVGDRSHRGALIPRVQDLGYAVTPVRERELSARVASSPPPAAVLVCLGETNAAELVDAVRRGRDDVPVVLLGSLGGELRDLADVLELGADHFLAAPVGDEELARVLAELAGPGAPDEDDVRSDEDEAEEDPVRPLTDRSTGGPVLGQLHRSLEALAARLQHHESGDSEPDPLDLESLGLDATPDVDSELYPPSAEPHDLIINDPESSDPAAPRRPEATQRISARPRAAHETDHEDSRGAMQGEETMRLSAHAAETTAQRPASGRRASDPPARVPVRAGRRASDAVLEAVHSDRHDDRDEPVRSDRHGETPTPAEQRLDVTDRLAVRPGERRQGERRWPAGPGETTARLLARRADDPRPGPPAPRMPPQNEPDDPSHAGHAGYAGHPDPADHPDHADRTARVLPQEGSLRAAVREPGRLPVGRFKIEAGDAGRFKLETGRLRAVRGAPDADADDDARVPPKPEPSETTARLATPRADLTPSPTPSPEPDVAETEPLVGIDVVDRLWHLHANQFDGRLTVDFTDGVRRQLWWRSGEPVYAASSAPGDGLVPRLQARGLLARAQAPAAARLVDTDLLPSARRLVGAGLLKPREQQEAVRDAVARIFEALCSDDAARWHIDDTPPPAVVTPDTPVLALLTAGARQGLGRERLREQLPGEMVLRLEVEDPAALARELGWPGAETWLLALDGARSLTQLLEEDGLDEHDLWVAACVLTAAGLATSADPDDDAALVEIDRQRIDERLALARASDYFALLGVRADAGRAEVLRAHTDLRATFADERLEPRTREALVDSLTELRAALDEARIVLLDEALRLAYTAGRSTEPETT